MDSSDLIPDAALASQDSEPAPKDSAPKDSTDDIVPQSALADHIEAPVHAKPTHDLGRLATAHAGSDNEGNPFLEQLTGLGSSIVGGYKGLVELAKGHGSDAAADAVTKYQEEHTYHAPEGTKGADVTKAMESPYNPLNYAGDAAHWAGTKVQDAGGSPGLATATEVIGNALPAVFGVKSLRAGAGKIAGAAADVAGMKPLAASASAAEPLEATGVPRGYYEPQAEVAAPQTPLTVEPSGPREPYIGPAQPADAPQTPLSLAPSDPRAPVNPQGGAFVVGKLDPRVASTKFAAVDPPPSAQPLVPANFPEHAPSVAPGQSLPPPEVAQRAKILQEVGIQQARKSALVGDAKAAATDYQSSKLDNPAGYHLKAQLDHEKNSIEGYSQKIGEETGGPVGNDQSANIKRGNVFLKPLDALKDYFDAGIKKSYATATERLGATPLEPTSFNKLLGTKSNFTGHTDTLNLRNGIQDRFEELTTDDAGNKIPFTAASAEKLRQYIGQKWTPNNGLIGKLLKNALDDDVAKAAGEDVYGPSRALRALRSTVLDDPKGISKIVDSDGPNGINRKVGKADVLDEVTGMDADQSAHIIKTLKNLPAELQPQGDAAINAIKAHYAQKVHDIGSNQAGQWNAKGVGKYLRENSVQMQQVFSPAEMKKFGTLNDAGNILKKDQSYPGAYVQEHNILRSGVATAVRGGAIAAGSAAGSVVGFPGLGAAVGGIAGNKLAGPIEAGGQLKAARARTVKLSELLGVQGP